MTPLPVHSMMNFKHGLVLTLQIWVFIELLAKSFRNRSFHFIVQIQYNVVKGK